LIDLGQHQCDVFVRDTSRRNIVKKFFRLAFVVALPLSLAVTANAQGAATTTGAEDTEERLDEGLKGFGYLTGLARGCVAGPQQTTMEREVLELHGSISRLLGTDRAFLFATSFGYGTSVKVEVRDCDEILKNYEARVEKHRAAAGGKK
jgi:hypothetical protein